MSHTRIKVRNGKKYAYEVTSYWDPQMRRARQKSIYLGVVAETGGIVPVGENKSKQELLILDFGDGFCLHHALKQSSLYVPLMESLKDNLRDVLPLILYRMSTGSALYNCEKWIEGNVLTYFYAGAGLSSQQISRTLALLGDEAIQRQFFDRYLKSMGGLEKTVIIDATALPNQIQSGFSAWGYADGGIEKQFRLLCVLDCETKRPLFYRYLPGNLSDVSTLTQTMAELAHMGIKNSFALMDAGYFSESNILDLYERKIDFLTRLPAGRALYKQLVTTQTFDLEQMKYASKYGTRGLFVKMLPVDLYGHEGFAYLVLDPTRKGKEMNALLAQGIETAKEGGDQIDNIKFNRCGLMILISSKKIEAQEVVSCYYMRQAVEQVFGFCKDDLNLLPIRRHNERTIRGYLFMQFLALILFIELREKLLKLCTVEQALMLLRHLKCKVFEKELLISEPTKKQKEILDQISVMAPTSMGI